MASRHLNRLSFGVALGYQAASSTAGYWRRMTGWTYLGVAIILEIAATTMLKLSNGLARWHFAAGSIALYAVCFLALAPALKTIPVGIAYAVWSGVGIIAMAGIGMLWFDQKLTILQAGCILLVLVGAIGLRVSTPG